jgi:hypothetical protein
MNSSSKIRLRLVDFNLYSNQNFYIMLVFLEKAVSAYASL